MRSGAGVSGGALWQLLWRGAGPCARIGLALLSAGLLYLTACGWHRILFVPSPERAFAGSIDPGTFEVREGLPILVLEGTPEEIGRRHGERLGEPIRELLAPYLERLYGERLEEARAKAKALEPMITEDHRAELRALAKAAVVPYDDLVLASATADLCESFMCSVLAASGEATADGPLVVGRNLDFPGFGFLDGYSLLFVVRPAGKRAFVAVGFPGMIGVLTGMNQDGVTVADLVVFGQRRDETGVPHLLRQRSVLEQCKTAAEGAELARAMPAAAGQTIVVADAKEAFALELAPGRAAVRRAERGVLVATNDFAAKKDGAPKPIDCPRYARLEELAAEGRGKLGVEPIRSALAATSLDWINLHAIVLVPAERTMYLARGRTLSRASDEPYVRIALGPAFRAGRGPRDIEVLPVPAVVERPRRYDEPVPGGATGGEKKGAPEPEQGKLDGLLDGAARGASSR